MTDAAKKLMEEVLALPAEDRKRIGAALLDSVDDEALRETVLRRIGEIQRGEAVVRDAMDVYHRLSAKRDD